MTAPATPPASGPGEHQGRPRAARAEPTRAQRAEAARAFQAFAALSRIRAWADRLDGQIRQQTGPEAEHPVAAHLRHLMADVPLAADVAEPPGPDAAATVSFEDPRVTALSTTYHRLGDDPRLWDELGWDERHLLRRAARDWLRAAVAAGLLPPVDAATGRALATVPQSVCPVLGTPRADQEGEPR